MTCTLREAIALFSVVATVFRIGPELPFKFWISDDTFAQDPPLGDGMLGGAGVALEPRPGIGLGIGLGAGLGNGGEAFDAFGDPVMTSDGLNGSLQF